MFLGIAPLVAAITLAPTAFGQKVDPRIRERAQSEAAVPVFIVLAHQPQREISQRTESANALYGQVAESRGHQAVGAEELREARAAAEAVLLRTRKQAFQAIEQAVGPEQDALEGRLKGLGATRIFRYLGINMLAAEIPASAITPLEADPEIARVFAVEKQYPQLATSVPALGAPAFWNAGYTGQGESVGILDSGVRTNYPAFAGVPIVSQIFLTNGSTYSCFADNAGSAEDEEGHGTHVAGIVASQGSAGWTNYQGVAKGIGTLYNLKIAFKTLDSDSCGSGSVLADERDVAAALDWAVANTPLKIFNYSYGATTNGDDDDGFTQSIDQYIDNYGLTVTIAAGNGGLVGYGVTSPGIAYNGITVANWVSRGVINPSSSRGPTQGGRGKPDLAAPGTGIYSTNYNWDAQFGTGDDFVSMTGTSMAAPHIAGSVALLESAGVTDPLAVRALLINTADSSGDWVNDAGWGYTNLNTALAQLNYATDSLGVGGVRLYRMPASGAFRATALWNRHVSGSTSSFNNMSLCAYDAGTGATIYCVYSGRNVEQASGTYSGDVVLAATMLSAPLAGVDFEPYAIALSSPWRPVSGPQISPSCDPPASITSGSQFSMVCSVNNTGDLPAFGVTGQVTLPDGFSGTTQVSFGEVPAGSFATATLNLTAPTAAGTYTLRFATSAAASFGLGPLADAAESTAIIRLALEPPALASPVNGASGVAQTPTLTWSASPGATGYDVYLGGSASPPLAASVTGTSYTPSTLSPGTMMYWRVVARNSRGSSSSATWSFSTGSAAPGQQQYLVLTVAGNGTMGYSGDGGPATSAQLQSPATLALDSTGNLYIADPSGQVVRKLAPNGIITTLAGNGAEGFTPDGAQATSGGLNYPEGVAVDAVGYVYIAEASNSRVRKVSPDGIITTVAGNGYPAGLGAPVGDGGPATGATMSMPEGVAVNGTGSIWIADAGSAAVRKVAPDGIISTVAGNGTYGFAGDGGPATAAELWGPNDLVFDAAGNLYISDSGNRRVRKIAPDGIITTVAGNGLMASPGSGCPGAVSSNFSVSGIALVSCL